MWKTKLCCYFGGNRFQLGVWPDHSSLEFPSRFVTVDLNSDRGKSILSVVQRSYIDTAYKNQRWHVCNIVDITNQHIINKYR